MGWLYIRRVFGGILNMIEENYCFVYIETIRSYDYNYSTTINQDDPVKLDSALKHTHTPTCCHLLGSLSASVPYCLMFCSVQRFKCCGHGKVLCNITAKQLHTAILSYTAALNYLLRSPKVNTFHNCNSLPWNSPSSPYSYHLTTLLMLSALSIDLKPSAYISCPLCSSEHHNLFGPRACQWQFYLHLLLW